MELDTMVCGDCLDVMADMPDECVDLIITDPPFGLGKFQFDEWSKLADLLRETAQQFRRIAKSSTPIMVFSSIEFLNRFLDAFGDLEYRWLLFLYLKNNMKYAYPGLTKHNPILWFDKDRQSKRTKMGRDIIEVCIKRRIAEYGHLTPKPEEGIAYLVEHYSNEGDIVFDPFMGSGTTAVAALKLRRRFYGCDIELEHIKWINKRIEKAKLETAQLSFNLFEQKETI